MYYDTSTLPQNILELRDDAFLAAVKKRSSQVVVDILQVQGISDVDTYLEIGDKMDFIMKYTNADLLAIRKKACIELSDGLGSPSTYAVLPGVKG